MNSKELQTRLADRLKKIFPEVSKTDRMNFAQFMLNEFLDILALGLKENYKVKLTNFGVFKLSEVRAKFKGWAIRFKASPNFKEQIVKGRYIMEKYGTEIDKVKELAAKTTGNCPDCGTPLKVFNPQPHCEKCGVLPFEKKVGN